MKEQLFWIEFITTTNSTSSPEDEFVLELATAITDETLKIILKGPQYVFKLQEEKIPKDIDGVFTKEILASNIDIKDVEKSILEFIKEAGGDHKIQLAGSNCSRARALLRRYFPKVNAKLDYHNLDIRTIIKCCQMWNKGEFAFEKVVRADKVVQDAIEILKKIKGTVFQL